MPERTELSDSIADMHVAAAAKQAIFLTHVGAVEPDADFVVRGVGLLCSKPVRK